MAWFRALKLLREGSGVPVAPHVAAQLVRVTGGDREWLGTLAIALSSSQLAGLSSISEVLPAGPPESMRRRVKSFNVADRRLILIASLMWTDRVSLLADAAAVSAERFSGPSVRAVLRTRNGVFELDPSVRAAIRDIASMSECDDSHSALARSSRRLGWPLYASWHAAQAGSSTRTDLSHLTQLARVQSSRGAVTMARRAADAAAILASQRGDEMAKGTAFELGAAAALWSGHLWDAHRLAGSIGSSSENRARGITAASESMLMGAVREPDFNAASRRSTANLLAVAPSQRDRVVMAGLRDFFGAWEADPDRADRAFAKIVLGGSRALPDGRVSRGERTVSPLAEAHVRALQIALQAQANDVRAAADTLNDSITRLPVLSAYGGLVVPLLPRLVPHLRRTSRSLVSMLEELLPAGAATPSLSGNRVARSTLATAGPRRSFYNVYGRARAPMVAAPLVRWLFFPRDLEVHSRGRRPRHEF